MGQPATLFGEPQVRVTPRPLKKLCADYEGYSLHAGVRIGTGTGSRKRLERLSRYICRPVLAQDRLSVARDGSIVYRFRKAWRNGKSAVVMDPMTFLSRLAALVPPPRTHVLSYYGVLGAGAARRDEIVLRPPPEQRVPHSCKAGSPQSARDQRQRPRRSRIPWAILLERVFLDDILRCGCGGRRRVLSMVRDPASIERVLLNLGLPTKHPPRAVPGSLPFAYHQ